MDDEEGDGSGNCPYLICFISEFIATGLLLHYGCMCCLWDFGMGPTLPAFGFGFVILAIVQIFGHITPVHINPAVTVAVLILGKMHWKVAVVYILAQYTGAIVGMYLLTLVTPYAPRLGLLQINFNISEIQGFFLEFGGTFVLFMTVAGVIHPRNEKYHDSTAIRIGLTITGLVFAIAPFSGCGINPARALAPALIYVEFDGHWLYQVGPYAGAVTGALLCRFVLDPDGDKTLYRCAQKIKI